MRTGKPFIKTLGPVLLLAASLVLPVEAAPAHGRQAAQRAAQNRSRGQQGQVIDGWLSDEGAECPALRDHGGRLWTLTGDAHSLRPGEHVRLYGRVVDGSACAWQGTTFEVLEVKNVWADEGHSR
jgi:hypothetical protein